MNLEEIKTRWRKSTDAPKINRYDHGGGRMYVDLEDGTRKLIADLYDEGNREFYYFATSDMTALIAEVERLGADNDQLRATLIELQPKA